MALPQCQREPVCWGRRRVIALGSVLLTGCATRAVEQPPSEATAYAAAPVIRPDAYWEYTVRDAYSGTHRSRLRLTVRSAQEHRLEIAVTRDDEAIDTEWYTPAWQGLAHQLRNVQRLTYAPALPLFEFPLYPGRRWRAAVTSTDPATGARYRTHVHASVAQWQRLRVPAGEFDTLPIHRQIYAGNAEFFKHQEEIVETDWYAPAVGYIVRSEGTSSHLDTSRSGGGRGRYLRVRGDWLIAELVAYRNS